MLMLARLQTLSFALQSLSSYKSFLLDRSFDFTCFAVAILFLWYSKQAKLGGLWTAVNAALTAAIVFTTAATSNVFSSKLWVWY